MSAALPASARKASFLACLFAAVPAHGEDAVRLPDAFLISRGPSFERAAAEPTGLDGTAYTVIAPTFNGSDGNLTYLRLGNNGTAASTYGVTVLGTPTGRIYGTAQLTVPPNASIQYVLSEILGAAAAGALVNGDTAYSLYVRNTGNNLSIQHVIYNNANGFFENVSLCKFVSGANYTHLNSRLANIHTSRLATYPAQIYVHNDAATAATYTAVVYDSVTGARIGAVPITVGANATFSQPFTWFEQQVNWALTSIQYHANLEFQATGATPYAAQVSLYIYNQQLAAYVNMSQRCGV